jgi:ABC-type sugar transport system permease subunit
MEGNVKADRLVSKRVIGSSKVWNKMKENKVAILFILPSLLLLVVFMIFPFFYSVAMSFYSWNGIAAPSFIGIENYTGLLTDLHFWKAVKNNLIFTILFTTFTIVLGFLFAVAIERKVVGWRIYKFVFFIPVMLITAIIAALFARVYEPSYGVLNSFLAYIGLENLQQLWLGNSKITIYSIIAVAIWQITGWTMLLFLAAIEGIPTEIHEAATLDGVTGWERIYYIILPMVKRVTLILIMLQIINSLKTFDLIWVMTQGGPNYASEVLGTILYRTAFAQQQFGYASAVAVMMCVLVMFAAVIYLRFSKISTQEKE